MLKRVIKKNKKFVFSAAILFFVFTNIFADEIVEMTWPDDVIFMCSYKRDNKNTNFNAVTEFGEKINNSFWEKEEDVWESKQEGFEPVEVGGKDINVKRNEPIKIVLSFFDENENLWNLNHIMVIKAKKRNETDHPLLRKSKIERKIVPGEMEGILPEPGSIRRARIERIESIKELREFAELLPGLIENKFRS